MSFHKIHLPVEDTPEEALKAYTSAERALVLEVATRFDEAGQAEDGSEWFTKLMNSENHIKYRGEWRNQWDPTFIFGEIAFIGSGPIRETLPVHDPSFNDAFNKARRIRNKWAHDFRPRSLTFVLVDILYFLVAAQKADLKVVNSLNALASRIRAISNGSWSATTATASTSEPEVAAADLPEAAAEQFAVNDQEREAESEAFEGFDYVRPVVGELWRGPIPTRKLKLQPKLHDVIDEVTGQSIRAELGDLADVTIERWIQLRPAGDLYSSDDDSAVLGYVAGRPRLIGYLGPEPEYADDVVRGFIMPYSYEIAGADVRCVETGELLSTSTASSGAALASSIAKAKPSGADLYVTTHGDVVFYGENGIEKFTTVDASAWFAGQLI